MIRGADVVKISAALQPDVVLVGLDGVAASGIETCRRIRARFDVPIVLTSEANVEIDLSSSASRSVPTGTCGCRAIRSSWGRRIEALVRRSARRSGTSQPVAIRVGDVTLDRRRHATTPGPRERGRPCTLEPVRAARRCSSSTSGTR